MPTLTEQDSQWITFIKDMHRHGVFNKDIYKFLRYYMGYPLTNTAISSVVNDVTVKCPCGLDFYPARANQIYHTRACADNPEIKPDPLAPIPEEPAQAVDIKNERWWLYKRRHTGRNSHWRAS